MRLLICAFALACAAPALHAQECTWEVDRPARGRAAQEDSVRRVVSAANRSVILEAAAAAGVAEPSGVVVFSMEPNGDDPMVVGLDGSIRGVALAGLVPGMVERAKSLPRRGQARVFMHARLDTLPLPAARADGKRRECRPQLTNRSIIGAAIDAWVRSQSATTAPRAATALLGLFVGRDGRVLHAEVARRSGSRELDELATSLAPRFLFRPASLDGVARDVWVVIPIQVST